MPRTLEQPVASLPGSFAGMTLVPLTADTWRVVSGAGRALGQLAVRPGDGGLRFHARRYRAQTRSFADIGAFWTASEALECLRLSR